jgi:hypothetical protein
VAAQVCHRMFINFHDDACRGINDNLMGMSFPQSPHERYPQQFVIQIKFATPRTRQI